MQSGQVGRESRVTKERTDDEEEEKERMVAEVAENEKAGARGESIRGFSVSALHWRGTKETSSDEIEGNKETKIKRDKDKCVISREWGIFAKVSLCSFRSTLPGFGGASCLSLV